MFVFEQILFILITIFIINFILCYNYLLYITYYTKFYYNYNITFLKNVLKI